jgi:hypothetical protein
MKAKKVTEELVFMQVLHKYREVTGFVSGQDLLNIWCQLTASSSGKTQIPVELFKSKFPLIWQDINRKQYSILTVIDSRWKTIKSSIDLVSASDIMHENNCKNIETVILRDEVAQRLDGLLGDCFADCNAVYTAEGYTRIDYYLAPVETK